MSIRNILEYVGLGRRTRATTSRPAARVAEPLIEVKPDHYPTPTDLGDSVILRLGPQGHLMRNNTEEPHAKDEKTTGSGGY